MATNLVTGSSGFLGRYLSHHVGKVITLGRRDADLICDLVLEIPKIDKCDTILHAAGKAHMVPTTVKEKQEFFNVNVLGTQNLLSGLEQAPSLPKSFVFISTVAVYGLGSGVALDEHSALSATDPYGLSKIQAEKVIQEWCAKHNVICGILRLPLLVGANPPGNLGAMIKGIKRGYYFNIAGGVARKSMVMAEDVAKIIPKLAEVGGTFNLTDGYHPSFLELSNSIARQLNKENILNIPFWLANSLARVGDQIPKFPINTIKLSKITSDLTFDDTKARRELGWNPGKVLDHFFIK